MFFLLALAVSIWSCAGGKKLEKPPREEVTPVLDESFDPLILNDDDIQFPETPPPAPGSAVSEKPVRQPETTAGENVQIDGFRVQLFATKNYENALVAQKEAEFVFAEYGHRVYVEFDAPYYKVRVGDCKTREEAEALRELARRNGYPSAWIVKTRVWSNPPLPEAAAKPPDSH